MVTKGQALQSRERERIAYRNENVKLVRAPSSLKLLLSALDLIHNGGI
jgi:hypothetical protein